MSGGSPGVSTKKTGEKELQTQPNGLHRSICIDFCSVFPQGSSFFGVFSGQYRPGESTLLPKEVESFHLFHFGFFFLAASRSLVGCLFGWLVGCCQRNPTNVLPTEFRIVSEFFQDLVHLINDPSCQGLAHHFFSVSLSTASTKFTTIIP